MMMNCSRAAETDAPVCELMHTHTGRQQKEKAEKAAIQMWRRKREKESRARKEGRKARRLGDRRKRGDNKRDE